MTTVNCKESFEKKAVSLITSPDIFKTVVLLVSILGVCPLLGPSMERYLKLLHVYAGVVLVFDLLGEKRIFYNSGRSIFFVFAVCGMITLLGNRNLLNFSGLSNFCYLMEALALVYSYGNDSKKYNRWASDAVCAVIFAANVVGIWMFYTKFYLYIPERGYVGMYPRENRLAGLFGNPNVLGMICLVSICLSLIQLVRNRKTVIRVLYGISVAINLLVLLLANSRTQIYSLMLLSAVVAFMLCLQNNRSIKGICLAAVAALVVLLVSFGCCQLLQLGLAKLDVNYAYYETHIMEGGIEATESIDTAPSMEATTESGIEATESIDTAPSMEATTESGIEATESIDTAPSVEATTESGIEATDYRPETTGPAEDQGSTIQREAGFAGMSGRIEIWIRGIELFRRKPLIGWGMDNLDYALRAIGVDGYFLKGNLHNTYLDVLVNFGILGFLCLMAYLLLMLGRVIAFFRNNKGDTWCQGAVMLGCVMAFLLDAVADSTLLASIYPTAIGFWFVVSQFAGLMDEESRSNGTYSPEPVGRLAEAIKNSLGENR